MERKNLIRSALTVRGRSGRSNRAGSRRGIRLAPLLLVAVMLAAVAMLAETSNPSQTAHAHDATGTHTHGTVVCTSPPAASCPTYEDADLPAEITVWSATLTAGTISANFVGYRDDPIGSLSDTTLSYGGTNYTIDQFGIGFGLLQFSLSSELASTPTNLN